MSYLNRKQKETLLSVIVCMTNMQCIANDPQFNDLKREANMAKTYCRKWADKMLEDVDEDDRHSAYRTALDSEISIRPKPVATSQTKIPLVAIPADVAERLTADALAACFLCEKCGKEIKKCQRRKDLLMAGVEPRDPNTDGCPFAMNL